MNPSSVLRGFVDALGGDHQAWRMHEQATELTYPDVKLSRAAAIAIPHECLKALGQEFGAALSCAFVDDDDVLLRVDSNVDAESMARLARDSEGLDECTLQFRLDKQSLAAQWYSAPAGCRPVVYFYPEAFSSLLEADPRIIEERLWQGVPESKVIVVLPSESVFMDGPALAIVGGDDIDRLTEVSPQGKVTADRLAATYAAATEHLYWRRRWARFLTPQHFEVHGHGERIGFELRRHAARFLPLYTADKSVETDDGIVCSYSGPEFSVDVTIPEVAKIGDIDDVRVAGMQRFLAWIYEVPIHTKRFSIAQLVIARHLHFVDPDQRFERLLEVVGTLIEEVMWTEKMAIMESLKRYSSEIRSLEDYVDKTVQNFSEQVTALVKSFTDTVVAGLGTIVLGMLAVLVKEGWGSIVFGLTLIAYGVYVRYFQIEYSLKNHRDRANIISKDFLYRCDKFKERIFGQSVDSIVGQRVENSRLMLVGWMDRVQKVSMRMVYASVSLGFLIILLNVAWPWLPSLGSTVAWTQSLVMYGESPAVAPSPAEFLEGTPAPSGAP